MNRTLSVVLLLALALLAGVMHWEDLLYFTSPAVLGNVVQESVIAMQSTPFWPVWLASTTLFVVLVIASGGLSR